MTALPLSAVSGANLIAAEFFQKPLDPGELVAAIRRRLGSVRSEQPQASI
jgi:DNA-binding response OmpR family regulator